MDRSFAQLAGCLERLSRHDAWAGLIAAAALIFGLSTPAFAQWQPNETRASAQTDLIDFEFSQSRGMFVWND